MSILSLTSLKYAYSLYSNMSPKSSANNGLVKIMDSIGDQYMTSAISNEMIMKDLSGFYTRQGTSLQSSLGFPQNCLQSGSVAGYFLHYPHRKRPPMTIRTQRNYLIIIVGALMEIITRQRVLADSLTNTFPVCFKAPNLKYLGMRHPPPTSLGDI